MSKKWQKLIQQLCPIHMHILIPWGKHMQSFKTMGAKLQEELRSQDTHVKCWRMDGRTYEQTETCTYVFLLKQVRQKAGHVF